jgi:phosphotransferase system IIB component
MSIISLEELQNSNLQTTISQIELINPIETEIKSYFLKTTKSGHLYNHPIYTAFNKTNLGSIPSKIETTLVKTPIKKKYSIFNPKPNNESTTIYNPSSFKKNSVSFSKKGLGNGFISKSQRFDNLYKEKYKPGPCEYSKDKLTIMNNIKKSIFCKGLFNNKENHSILPKNNFPGPCDYNPKFLESDNFKNKNSPFFTSESERFKDFCNFNSNPGPGKYFDKIIEPGKNNNKESYFFKGNVKKKDNPTKRLKIDVGDFEKSNFKLIDKKGEINTNWRNPNYKITGNEYEYNFQNENNENENKENKIFKKFKPEKYKNKIKEDEKKKNNFNYKIFENLYIPINPNSNQKNDLFTLYSPRWKKKPKYNTESKFTPPGPAYYNPKYSKNKISFNLNVKDFIYTNGISFNQIKKI